MFFLNIIYNFRNSTERKIYYTEYLFGHVSWLKPFRYFLNMLIDVAQEKKAIEKCGNE